MPSRRSLIRLGELALAPVTGGAAYLLSHPPRRRPGSTPAALGLPYETVRFRARDGLPLAGWWVPAAPGPARATVVLCHAYACNRAQMLPCLSALHRNGYHALLFDFRAHGESGGRRCGLGHTEVADLLGAVDWLATLAALGSGLWALGGGPELPGKRKCPVVRGLSPVPCSEPRAQSPERERSELPIAVLGLSMGGAVALMAAAHCPSIAAVVADSVFPSLDQAIERRCRLGFGLLAPVAEPPTKRIWRALHGYDPAAVAPERVIASLSPRPVMVIHCGLDIYLSEAHSRALFEQAREPREFWHVKTALHARAHATYPDAYMARVLDFLQRYGL